MKKRRILSAILCIAMVLSTMSFSVFAGETATVAAKIGNIEYSTLADAIVAAKSGDTVTLLTDITAADEILIDKSLTLDLGAYTITGNTEGTVLRVYAPVVDTIIDVTVNATTGGITNNGIGPAIYAGEDLDGGEDAERSNLTINGGNYVTAGKECIRQIVGLCTINDGTYKSTFSRTVLNGERWYGAEFVINGGSFYGFNPECVSVWTGFNGKDYTNFYHQHDIIADGKNAEYEDGWYTVIDGSEEYKPLVETKSLCYPNVGVAINAVSAMNDVANLGTITLNDNATLSLKDTKKAIEYGFSFVLNGNTLTLPAGYMLRDTGIQGDIAASVISTNPDAEILVAKIGGTEYSSLQEAVDAAASGAEIVILSDVELTNSLAIAKDDVITLDLNGHEIFGTDTKASGNFELISNKGILAINDSVGGGEISLTAETDRDWNAYSAVIANLGGTLTVNGGTIIHNGGTDMAYAIDNNSTLGDTNLTINNGKVLSNVYRAVRQFANSTANENNVTVNGGVVKGGSAALGNNAWSTAIWMQSPNSGANKAGLTVTEEAQIGSVNIYNTGDVSNFEVSVAGDALIQNDPAGVASVLDNVADENYKIEVNNGNYVLEQVSYVAQIDDTKYTTLAAAVSAANAGDIITLLDNVELTDGLVIAKDDVITLNLAGYTISYASDAAKSDAAITNNGNLTITGNGKITYSSSTPSTAAAYATNTITNCGTLTVENGTIENTTATGASYAVDNNSTTADVSLIVNNGNVTAVGIAVRQFVNSAANENNVTVNGGAVTGKRAVMIQLPGNNNTAEPKASLDINGGTLTATGENGGYQLAVYSYSFGNSYNNVSIDISAGTVVGDVAVGGGSGNGGSGAEKVRITGGTITDVYTYNGKTEDNIAISGGTFEVAPDDAYLADGFTVKENENGTFGVEEKFEEDVEIINTRIGGTQKKLTIDNVEKRRLYIFAGIDSLDYVSLGFEVTAKGETVDINTKTVYDAISVTMNGQETIFNASDFDSNANDGKDLKYVFGQGIRFPENFGGETVTVRAYAEKRDGTKIYSGAYTFVIKK